MSKIIQKHILKQFQIRKELGSGSYGYVWQVVSKRDQKKYALKKVFDAFRNDVDAQRTYRQIQALLNLQSKYIIRLERVVESKNRKDVYLICQLMQTDLSSVINLQVLENTHQKFIFLQILMGLEYIQSKGLIHRDLKPSNILVNSSSQIKICDFGLVRSLNNQEQYDQQNCLTEQVATKWYRAPQLLLGSNLYSRQIDVWSFGCIVAEVLLRRPIFNGLTTQQIFYQMLQLNEDTTGQDLLALKIGRIQNIYTAYHMKHNSFQKIIGRKNQQFVQLVQRCLIINPKKRITIKQAILLPLFNQVRHLVEIQKNDIQKPFSFSLDDNEKFQVDVYRQKIRGLIDQLNFSKETKDNIFSRKDIKLSHEQNQIKDKQPAQKQIQLSKTKFGTRSLHRSMALSPNSNTTDLNGSVQKNIRQTFLHKKSNFRSASQPLRNKSNFLSSGKKTCNMFRQKSPNLPYFKSQKITKKPISSLDSIQKIDLNRFEQKQQTFFNKFCKKGKQIFQIQISESQKQLQNERKLIGKYSMNITNSIYRSETLLNMKRSQNKFFFIQKLKK